jgi:hypothetical protein
MVTGQLLRLSSAMSGGVLDIYSSLSLLLFLLNVNFLIMHQIDTRNTLLNKILWLNLTVKYSVVFSLFTRFVSVSLITY